MQGTLYEIFVTNDPKNEIDRIGKKQGYIKKIKKGQYSLIIENGEDRAVIENIADEFNQVYASLSRFISMGLRHGVPLQFIVDQLNKDKNFIGFEKSVGRVLKKYIKEGERVLTDKCADCGGELIFQEGCIVCPSCGWGKCG
jgi:ribonucleoside-diphosphate reductase alpha chain